jgi:hypothetical protein
LLVPIWTGPSTPELRHEAGGQSDRRTTLEREKKMGGGVTSCAPANQAGCSGASCSADSSESDFLNVLSQVQQSSSGAGPVCTDPTAPTPREEALQRSLPENERNLPPPVTKQIEDDASSPKTTPQPKAIGGWPTTQSLDTGPKFTDEQIYGETDAAAKRIDEQIAKDRAILQKPDQGGFWDDVKAGVVGAVKGIAEPALVVMDFGQMGAAMVTHAITGDPDDLDVHFLSGTGKRIAASDDPWATGARAGVVLATAIPTGGGSVLVDNVATAIATGDPDQARHILVQGAVGQVTAVGIAVGVSSATGNGLTGRGSEGATETGRGSKLNSVQDVRYGRSEEEFESLASDPAHGGKISIKSIQERTVGLELEKAGKVPGPITRDPTGAAEFIDGKGNKWDVKGFNSNFSPKKGGFSAATDAGKVDKSLALGENVMLDTSKMNDADVAALKSEGTARGWGDRVQYWP